MKIFDKLDKSLINCQKIWCHNVITKSRMEYIEYGSCNTCMTSVSLSRKGNLSGSSTVKYYIIQYVYYLRNYILHIQKQVMHVNSDLQIHYNNTIYTMQPCFLAENF